MHLGLENKNIMVNITLKYKCVNRYLEFIKLWLININKNFNLQSKNSCMLYDFLMKIL